MTVKPRYRISITQPLGAGRECVLTGNAAHYLSHVLRLYAGDAVAVFNREDGEWLGEITHIGKRDVVLRVGALLRAPQAKMNLTVCCAPIKGGRLETIIEKATELGASVLQPVFTNRTIVDKVNRERAENIAREAAEQCERTDWPEIRPPLKFERFLGDWPADVPLIYGDESGDGTPVTEMLAKTSRPASYGILAGPEGGFSPEEFAMLRHVKCATGVSLGPRILRADTAVITLCVATIMAWGDWHARPRFTQGEN